VERESKEKKSRKKSRYLFIEQTPHPAPITARVDDEGLVRGKKSVHVHVPTIFSDDNNLASV
jgi:hypothetical protein